MPPRGRKRKEDSSNTTTGNNPTVSGRSAIIAPGGGTASDISKLSHNLGLPIDAVTAIMNCQGQGVRTSRRSGGGAAVGAVGSVGAVGGAVGAMSNVWGDFMNEEMPASSSSAPQPTVAVDASERSKRGENPPSESTNANAATNSTSADAATAATATATTNAQPSNGPRSYILPIPPRMKQPKQTHDNSYDPIVPTPGLLAQTGTLDASIPGRSSISKTPSPHQLECPTLLFPNSIFQNVKFAFIATSPTACHSVAITTDGVAYGWGRNETGQLGLGYTCAVVPLPVKLTIPGEEEKDLTFVGGGVGKYHTILVASNGMAYGSGFNKCGQLGINHSAEQVDKFRKCVVMGQMRMGEEDTEGEDANVKIVQASCGENISALISSNGHLYTAGSSEFGQLGNGETGEYIVSAGKLGYSNCSKFMRRSAFVQSENDAAAMEKGGMSSGSMTTGVDSSGKVKCISLPDSSQICLANVSCGKNHMVAVEAASLSSEAPRVFTWGSGDYGCLGHAIQADEYTPRLVGALRGPIFANNHPVEAVAGSNCTIVKTKNGHVYYFGKHKSAGEATMRPTLVDALANNGHVVAALGAGSMTVFCSTKNGVTVSWGNGSHGELGYGKGENKSSAKPKFVNGVDSCLVTDVSCGFGHTLFLIRNEDDEDAKALKKVAKVEEADIAQFVNEVKSKKISGDAEEGGADQPAKKKQRGKGKKN